MDSDYMHSSQVELKNKIKSPNKESFENKQIKLFQEFFANTDTQRSEASNCIELWDNMPRYSISQQSMNKMRDEKGRLDLLEVNFNYRQASLKLIIQPALIQEVKNGVKTTTYYYPSANEELVEEALRKIAAKRQMGFHELMKRSGVVFTLYQLREELKRRGHARSFKEVIKSLTILSSSIIEINGDENNQGKTYGKRSAYFPAVTWVNKLNLTEDPNSKWHVQFHPLVTDSIDRFAYRQYNYNKLMNYKTQLARWLYKYLVTKYTMASKMKLFVMRYSTIKRDSFMLNGYKMERHSIAACDNSLNELKTQEIAHSIRRETVTGPKNKIVDVIFTITPTLSFISEVKAANARQGKARQIKEPVNQEI